MIQFADEALLNDQQFMRNAHTQNGQVLFYAKDPFKEDYDIVYAAIPNDGTALKFCGALPKQP